MDFDDIRRKRRMYYYRMANRGGNRPSDVVIAVQEFDSRTTTGTLDVTTSALGGRTPKFAMILFTNHYPPFDPASSGSEVVSVGFATPVESYVVWSASDDSFETTRTGRGASATAGPVRLGFGNTLATRIVASVGAWIADGVTLNFTTVEGFPRRGAIVFFAGNDVSAELVTASLGTGTGAVTVGGLSVTPQLVIATGISHSTGVVGINPSGFHFGMALANGTQKSIYRTEAHAAADGAPELYISSNRLCADKNGSTVNYTVTAGNFTSNSFDVTPSASAGSDRLYFAVLNLGNKRLSLADFATPTGTGAQSLATGFVPQFALGVLTSLEARDTAATTSDLQGGFGIGLIGSNEQWAASFRSDSGAATTSTASDFKAAALRGASATSTSEVAASLTSFDSNGVNLNYSAVAATAKMGFMLAVEA